MRLLSREDNNLTPIARSEDSFSVLPIDDLRDSASASGFDPACSSSTSRSDKSGLARHSATINGARRATRHSTIWIADARRGDGKHFVVHADEKLTAFLEPESVIRAI